MARIYLQHLQSEHMAERWLLKSPAHLWHLPDLLPEYPDAVVIQTHRDPLKVVASVSALAAHLRRMASDETSIPEAAAQYADDIFVGIDRSLAARDDGTLPPDQVVDVQFTDFMSDPWATIKAVHRHRRPAHCRDRDAHAGLPRHPSGRRRRRRVAVLLRRRRPRCRQLRERSRPYQERFGVASEAVR